MTREIDAFDDIDHSSGRIDVAGGGAGQDGINPTGGRNVVHTERKSLQAPNGPVRHALVIHTAAEAGVGFATHSVRQLTSGYAGVKFGGGPLMLDFGYDRIQSRGRLSAAISRMYPVVRFPKPQADPAKNYVRVYAEPGVGYRVGCEQSGGYFSLKLMVALLSDDRLTHYEGPASPFLEIQRRFPLTSSLRGDTRVSVGLILAMCNHCGG